MRAGAAANPSGVAKSSPGKKSERTTGGRVSSSEALLPGVLRQSRDYSRRAKIQAAKSASDFVRVEAFLQIFTANDAR